MRKKGTSSLHFRNDAYKKWKSEKVSSTLAVVGRLGSGKSVLLANIVDDLVCSSSQNDTHIAYFFCQYDIPETSAYPGNRKWSSGRLARHVLMGRATAGLALQHAY